MDTCHRINRSLFNYLTKTLAVGALLSALCCGCNQNGPGLASVSGVVTLDGKPVDMATVSFFPEKGRASVGKTNAEGKYDLKFSSDWDGALLGNHRVTITTQYRAEESRNTATYDDNKPRRNPDAAGGRKELLPSSYTSPDKTELVAEVVAGDNSIDFDLTAKAEK